MPKDSSGRFVRRPSDASDSGGVVDLDSGAGIAAAAGEPAPDGGPPAEPEPRRRGGWPKGKRRGSGGSKPASPAAPAGPRKASVDVASLATCLQVSHFFIAMLTRCPEMQLHDEEAKILGQSLKNVLRHYDVSATAKTVDWITFGNAVLGTYTVRGKAIAERAFGVSFGPGHNGGPPMDDETATAAGGHPTAVPSQHAPA